MFRELFNAFAACVVTFILCAVVYPLAVWGLGSLAFPAQAEGSLIVRDGKVVGSELIGQPFASDGYFQPRPSAAGSNGYAADAASGSNLGTTNPALHDRIALDTARQLLQHTGDADLKARIDRLDSLQGELKARKEIKEPAKSDTEAIAAIEKDVASALGGTLELAGQLGEKAGNPVPTDLVTTSGSGLDPDISVEAARYQSARVALARNLPIDRVLKMIDANEDTSGAIIGAPPRVNVLRINLQLDKEAPIGSTATGTASPPSPVAQASPATPAAGTPTTSTPAASSSRPTAARPAPAAALAPAESGPSSTLEGLTKRLDRLQERVDASPVGAITTDVNKIKARMADLARAISAEHPATKRVGELDGRLTGFNRDIQAIRSELKAVRESPKNDGNVSALEMQVRQLRDEVKTIRDSVRKDATADVTLPGVGPDLSPAARLFRERNYAGAADALRALSAKYPDDARIWYLAALSNGFATGQWKGEAETLVMKGVDRERAGTPAINSIDEAFASLTKETGKDWLGYYRSQAAKR